MPGTVSNAFSVSSPLDLGSDLSIQAFLFPADHVDFFFFFLFSGMFLLVI